MRASLLDWYSVSGPCFPGFGGLKGTGEASICLPVRMKRMSPNFTSVPWSLRHAWRWASGIDDASKQLKFLMAGSDCFSRQLATSMRMPLPTMPCSAHAVQPAQYNSVSHTITSPRLSHYTSIKESSRYNSPWMPLTNVLFPSLSRPPPQPWMSSHVTPP